MAMALSSCSPALVASLASISISSACTSASSSGSHWKPAVSPFSGHAIVGNNRGYGNARVRSVDVVVVVKAAGDVIEASTSETAGEETAPAMTSMLSEAELLKKKTKKAELRRKRLVRKRKLRKKGKWPPSKMAKLKNV